MCYCTCGVAVLWWRTFYTDCGCGRCCCFCCCGGVFDGWNMRLHALYHPHTQKHSQHIQRMLCGMHSRVYRSWFGIEGKKHQRHVSMTCARLCFSLPFPSLYLVAWRLCAFWTHRVCFFFATQKFKYRKASQSWRHRATAVIELRRWWLGCIVMNNATVEYLYKYIHMYIRTQDMYTCLEMKTRQIDRSRSTRSGLAFAYL